MTHCIECGKPWGVIFDRGELPTPVTVDLARQELIELLRDQWDCDCEPETVDQIDWQHPDFAIHVAEIVYLTESLARFCDEHGICASCFLGDCWQELEHVDLPRWLLKGRKRRWAVLWDCCNIGFATAYTETKEPR